MSPRGKKKRQPGVTVKPVRKLRGKPSPATESGLVRYTLYFTPELLQKLERTWMALRIKTGEQVQKWRIINVLLEEKIEDVEYLEKKLRNSLRL